MFFWQKIKKLEEENKRLQDLLIKNQQPKITFWVITPPTEAELKSIWENQESIKNIIKYLTHKVVIRMDMLRNIKDFDREYIKKVWYLDCLNDMTLFFHNYLIKEKQDNKEYSWQNLK